MSYFIFDFIQYYKPAARVYNTLIYEETKIYCEMSAGSLFHDDYLDIFYHIIIIHVCIVNSIKF